MAINRLRKFPDIDAAQIFLNGGLIGGDLNMAPGQPGNRGPGITGLVGKTFKTKSPGPAGTCTFVASSGSNPDPNTLLFKDIAAQIQAAITGVTVRSYNGKIVVIETTPAHGITVDHTGTANALLGFDIANDTIAQFYTPAEVTPTAPCWTWAYSGNDNAHTIYTWE